VIFGFSQPNKLWVWTATPGRFLVRVEIPMPLQRYSISIKRFPELNFFSPMNPGSGMIQERRRDAVSLRPIGVFSGKVALPNPMSPKELP
jgi:hypothetical protein